jgi:hypothetical protein
MLPTRVRERGGCAQQQRRLVGFRRSRMNAEDETRKTSSMCAEGTCKATSSLWGAGGLHTAPWPTRCDHHMSGFACRCCSGLQVEPRPRRSTAKKAERERVRRQSKAIDHHASRAHRKGGNLLVDLGLRLQLLGSCLGMRDVQFACNEQGRKQGSLKSDGRTSTLCSNK